MITHWQPPSASVVVQDPDNEALKTLHQRVRESLKNFQVPDADIPPVLDQISVQSGLARAISAADIVFEAAPEDLALKQALFKDLEDGAPEDCVLASNTSVMPVTKIVKDLKTPARAVGTHWWNPPHIILCHLLGAGCTTGFQAQSRHHR